MHEISFRHDVLPLKDKLYRLALRITLDTAEAEDIVQDTMIKVWNLRSKWQEIESMEAFCLTIARNLAIDRSQKSEAQNEELDIETHQTADSVTPDGVAERNEQMELIHRIISRLPEKHRTVVQLRDIEGMSYKEIAEAMQTTEEQVKSTLFRARQRIKKEYNEIDKYGL